MCLSLPTGGLTPLEPDRRTGGSATIRNGSPAVWWSVVRIPKGDRAAPRYTGVDDDVGRT
jgi:hypothetical protein